MALGVQEAVAQRFVGGDGCAVRALEGEVHLCPVQAKLSIYGGAAEASHPGKLVECDGGVFVDGDFGEEGVDRTVHVCECIKDRCIFVVTGCAHKHAKPLALQLELDVRAVVREEEVCVCRVGVQFTGLGVVLQDGNGVGARIKLHCEHTCP